MIEVDRDSATVRLDDAGFDALIECAASPDGAGDPEAAMALASGRLDPAMSAIFNPEVTVTVELADAGRALAHRIWVSGRWATYLLDAPGDGEPRRLLTDARSFLPASLALLVDIRSTNVDSSDPVVADPAQLEAMFAADEVDRRAALTAVAATRAWRVTVTDVIDDDPRHREASRGEQARRVVMTDGPGGIRLWDQAGDRFEPITNTRAFRILTLTVPAATA